MRLLRTVRVMPSPVGHALGGLIVGLVGSREPGAGSRKSLYGPVAAAVLPDIDFLWGRHNMETHSLGAAALAGLAVLAWTRGRDVRLAVLVALAWASHVLFDWLGSDTTPPIGVMALWPCSADYYFAYVSGSRRSRAERTSRTSGLTTCGRSRWSS